MNPLTTQLSNLIRSAIVLLSTAFLAGPSQTYAQAIDDYKETSTASTLLTQGSIVTLRVRQLVSFSY